MTYDITRAAALLKPDNVSTIEEWQAFVKERNSQPYKRVKREDSDSIMRDDVYIRGHTQKNGELINELAGETLQKIKACSETVNSSSKHSLKDDGVAKVLGPER